jgi:hypothetical protein
MQMPEEKPRLEKIAEEKPFDSGSLPSSEQNIEAARSRSLYYDPRNKVYRDSDGERVRDRFGQPL